MGTILSVLSGKKTYFTSGLGLIVLALWMYGVIESDTATKALVAVGLGSQITLRSAVASSEAQAVETAQQVAALSRGDKSYVG